MLKKIIGIMIVLFLFTGCVRYSDGEPVNQEPDDSEEVAESPEVEEEEPVEEPEEEVEEAPEEVEGAEATMIALDMDPLTFSEFTVLMNHVELYQEDGTDYADVSFTWINQAGDGAKKFMAQSLVGADQGGKELEETSGAWDIENRNSSSLFFDNAENGEVNIDLTFELDNKEDPLRLWIQPLNQLNEESQEVKIDIK